MTKSVGQTMLAAEYDAYGPASAVHLSNVPLPLPQGNETLVRVQASSVNPIDLAVRSGKLRVRTGRTFPKRVGIDFAGVVAAASDSAGALQIGERVWGVMPLTIEKGEGQGSSAQYVTLPSDRLARSPKNLDPGQAAAISSVGAVALITLRDKAGVKAGERLLVRGAAGGVGSMVVQLGALMGARVTALASAADLDFCRGLGAHEALDYRTTEPGDLPPFDVIVDLVGTDLRRWRKLQDRGGRMFCLSIAGVSAIAYIGASRVYGSRRVRFFSASPTGADMADVATYVESGALAPVIHSQYPLSDVVAAQESLERGGGRGKRILLHPGGTDPVSGIAVPSVST